MHRTLIAVLTISIFSLYSSAAAALGRDRLSYLVVHHEGDTGRVDREDPPGKVIRSALLSTKSNFEISPGETLVVKVAEANPLLFTYKWKTTEKKETDDHKAVVEFVGTLKGLAERLAKLVGLPSTTGIEQAQRAPVTDPEIKELLAKFVLDLRDLTSKAEAIPGLIKQAAEGYDPAEAVRKKVELWEIEKLAAALEGELKEIKEKELSLLDETTPIIGDAIPESNKNESVTSPSPTEGTDAKNSKTTGQSGETSLEPSPGSGKTVESPGVTNATTGGKLGTASVVRLLVAKDQEEDIRKTLTRVKAFTSLALKIHDDITFEEALVFDPINNIGGVLEIGLVEASAPFAAQAKAKTGKFEFIVSPHSPVHYSVGAAAIYSFIEAKDFDTKTENGKISIIRKDSGDQVNGVTGAVMLSITPDAWSSPSFSGSIQLGVGPQKDKVGLFLGGAIRLFDLASVGAGIAYQQTEKLADNLQVGQEIASVDKLKTHAVFKSGLYVTLTIKVAGK